jgi:hypothetical protein
VRSGGVGFGLGGVSVLVYGAVAVAAAVRSLAGALEKSKSPAGRMKVLREVKPLIACSRFGGKAVVIAAAQTAGGC